MSGAFSPAPGTETTVQPFLGTCSPIGQSFKAPGKPANGRAGESGHKAGAPSGMETLETAFLTPAGRREGAASFKKPLRNPLETTFSANNQPRGANLQLARV